MLNLKSLLDPRCRFHKRETGIFIKQLSDRYDVHQLFVPVYVKCVLSYDYDGGINWHKLKISVDTNKFQYAFTAIMAYIWNTFVVFQLVSSFVQDTRRQRLPKTKGVPLWWVHFCPHVNWMATMKRSNVMVQLAFVGVLTNLAMNCLAHALERNQTVLCQVRHKSTTAQHWVWVTLKQQNDSSGVVTGNSLWVGMD